MATKKKPMSKQHKEALAAGREQGRIVRNYLEALETHKPRRGRKRTPESIDKRLVVLEEEMAVADPLRRLQLAQERLDLEDELASMDADDGLEDLEAQFIEIAADFAQRKGLSYAAFREVGVPAATLKASGISRSATELASPA